MGPVRVRSKPQLSGVLVALAAVTLALRHVNTNLILLFAAVLEFQPMLCSHWLCFTMMVLCAENAGVIQRQQSIQ